jgi:hypothetical protein
MDSLRPVPVKVIDSDAAFSYPRPFIERRRLGEYGKGDFTENDIRLATKGVQGGGKGIGGLLVAKNSQSAGIATRRWRRRTGAIATRRERPS